jgi:hypothetical protein
MLGPKKANMKRKDSRPANLRDHAAIFGKFANPVATNISAIRRNAFLSCKGPPDYAEMGDEI